MATTKLRLKAEPYSPPQMPAISRPLVEIWVKTSIPHLDQPFSYCLPEALSMTVDVGSYVVVPFQGRSLEGLVTNRRDGDISTLKEVIKPLSPFPMISSAFIATMQAAAERWISNPYDFADAAISPRVISVEREFAEAIYPPTSKAVKKGEATYLQLPPYIGKAELILRRIERAPKGSKIVVVVPEALTLQRVSAALESAGRAHAILDTSLSKSDLYRNYLQVASGDINIAIGLRNAVLAPMRKLSHMIIVDEQSEHYYDRRHPGWNVRDIALLRALHEGVAIEFLGYAPSAEMARIIDGREIKYRAARAKMNVKVFEQQRGELVPSLAIAPIRSSLMTGPVLAIVPAKGYAQAIRCAECRTISRCECGGALSKISKLSDIACTHCNKRYSEWQCAWCRSKKNLLAHRGIERFAQEIGLLFPKIEVVQSTADTPKFHINRHSLVLATPGMVPTAPDGYSAVVVLEGNRFLSQPDLRSSERVRGIYFDAIAQLREGAPAILIQDRGSPLVNALLQWNPVPLIHSELQELRDLKLPPYYSALTLDVPTNEVTRIKSALENGIGASLPQSTLIFGPADLDGNFSRLIISAECQSEKQLLATMREFSRKRSLGKKPIIRIRAFPYSLTATK